MPGTYPAAPPTLSGDLETISRFLQSPTQLRRRLRDYTDLRFVSDQILTQRLRSSGGAVLYEMSEPFVTDRAVESVSAGAEYPFANLPVGTAGIASVAKWGQKVRLTDEEIERNVYAGQAVDRNLRKVVNSVIKQVDTITMSAVASGITAYVQAGGGSLVATQWAASSGVKMLYDILMAKAKIVGLNLGYKPDTLLVGDTAYALMMSDTVITNALRREDSNNPVYTGQIETIGGLTIVVGGAQNAVDPYVLDSTQLGGMADEMDNAPGYAMDQLAVQIKSIRQEANDAFDLQGRRKTVPVIQEPGAGCKIAQAITTS